MRELSTPVSVKPNAMPDAQKYSEWLKFKTCGDKELEKAALAAGRWALWLKCGQQPCWLSLVGRSGTGKTHIVTRLFNWAIERMDTHTMLWTPHVVYWPRFVQQLRSGDAFKKRDDMLRWPVLCLDDVGSERDKTGFASEELMTLLGCRVGRWTLLTSNLDLDGIGAIDERIADRMIRVPNVCCEINTVSFAVR